MQDNGNSIELTSVKSEFSGLKFISAIVAVLVIVFCIVVIGYVYLEEQNSTDTNVTTTEMPIIEQQVGVAEQPQQEQKFNF